MVYQYVAYNQAGEVIKGKLAASTEDGAVELLDYAGYRVINLKEVGQNPVSNRLFGRLSRVKKSDVVLFYRQLALLIESGLNIVTALEILQSQALSRKLKEVIGVVISDLRGGMQLSGALSKHPDIFPSIHCRSLSVGEQTGSLETVLRQVADYTEKEINAAKSVKNALIYPIVASVVAVGVVIVMVTFVLPAFSDLYSSLGAELPPLTQMVIDASNALRAYGVYIMLGLLVVLLLTYAFSRTVTGRYQLDKLGLKLPLVGHVNLLNQLSRLSRNLSLLFRSGLSLVEIMPMLVQSSSNMVVARALVDVQQEMIKGEGLYRPMAKNDLFLPMLVQMVRVGEESGNLDTTLLAVAESYETEAEYRTRTLITLIQPAMILVIGGLVALIAISMFSAMYSIYGQVI